MTPILKYVVMSPHGVKSSYWRRTLWKGYSNSVEGHKLLGPYGYSDNSLYVKLTNLLEVRVATKIRIP